MLADCKIAANAGWNHGILKAVREKLIGLEDFAVELTGFEASEIDIGGNFADPADSYPEVPEPPISRQGDLWLLSDHLRLVEDGFAALDLSLRKRRTENAGRGLARRRKNCGAVHGETTLKMDRAEVTFRA